MSFQDPIADCLTRIRNGLLRGKQSIEIPSSKLKKELIDLLIREGYLLSCETIKKENKSQIEVHLKYIDTKPAIKKLSRVSKPSLRRYSGASDLKTVKNGLGIYVLSTNQGLLTDKQARSKNIGGEIICEVF
ncbi:30S ribosomal protein S8 [Gammaproteobacteria bacterium]|nr:30S ribosomal protein S8 [Gammaproteobacteria bacterium]|tara:strand:- start:144 stop:539 length:396 start_codon:yes stop_codon:yes gene_type:complete